ncbi:hypothetical protein OZX62_08845 [Bifidobacterium sp. ESL0690]|uniref:hypothetical protein n=1 Tax=Bifidobacterium sp. ESL0690 TaxID=2983214 RepID=UPI0023F8C0B0|nr:hypothetical protein [Bifidobacterium sp. ESL0690]WEV46526.1 hypothetical protein OZX62_08845 [Bifidobacterium sp. ESL0690]
MAQTQGDLVIDDDYVLGRGKAFSDRGNALEEQFDAFLKTLDDIAQTGIVSGSLHEATVAYRSVAAGLKGQFKSLGTEADNVCKSLIASVDQADDKLYER